MFHEGRPLPEPGDEVACTTQDAAGLPVRRLVGTVLPTRRLEICRDVKDMLTLWVRLRASLTLVEQGARQAAAGHLTTPARHKPSPDGKANGRLGLPAKQSKAAQRGQTD
ncbi:MAG: hypothetical protein HY000_17065 [Planctomycetes bacterium]|nr:hypothetical protein [Planctomycetota bacterium]